jgi:hypothetical protein
MGRRMAPEGLEGDPRAAMNGGKGPLGPVSEGARPLEEPRSGGGRGSPTAPMSPDWICFL